MKAVVKRAIRNETGAALLLAIILLLVGGLVSAALLGHMGTGILTGEVYDRRTAELYAADAGVEDAVWKIQNQVDQVKGLTKCYQDWSYNISDAEGAVAEVNDKGVEVTITLITITDNMPCDYRVVSRATGDGSSTTVEAYVEAMSFDLFAGALVSKSDISLKKDTTAEGDVYYVTEIRPPDFEPTGGEKIQVPADAFPTQGEIDDFARELKALAMAGGICDGTMSIDSNTSLNSIYIAGDLHIAADVTLTIDGVVYVKGSVWVKKEVDNYNLVGSGSLIAEGDIDLRKTSGFGATGDSIIMSLYGAINFKKEGSVEAMIYAPNGPITMDKEMTVVGSVVGASIQADKNGSFTYVPKASSFGFFAPVVYGAKIKTYTINP